MVGAALGSSEPGDDAVAAGVPDGPGDGTVDGATSEGDGPMDGSPVMAGVAGVPMAPVPELQAATAASSRTARIRAADVAADGALDERPVNGAVDR